MTASQVEPIVPPVANNPVAAVCALIPPLWDLANFVAVNPFLGFTDQPLVAAAQTLRDGLNGQLLPSVAYYRQRWSERAFDLDDLRAAAARDGQDPEQLAAILDGAAPPLRESAAVLTRAERHDRRFGTAWNDAGIRHVARWCASAIPSDRARWRGHAAGSLYAGWREYALADRSLALAGLRGWRTAVAALPATADAAVAALLAELGVPAEQQAAYLYRLLGGVYGWACYLRRETWQGPAAATGALGELIAVRLCVDALIARLAPRPQRQPLLDTPDFVEDECVLAVLQDALEDGYARGLIGSLRPPAVAPQVRPVVQAIFCIDVRSEPLRRQLEAQSDTIATQGFAGFFGVSLDWQLGDQPSARCPVLLQPAVAVRAERAAPPDLAGSLLKSLPSAPVAGFTFVELAGLAYAAGLAGATLALRPSAVSQDATAGFSLAADGHGHGLTDSAATELAAGILINMGLREVFARLVLLCGHGGQSANNPHAAGLDCGACGGHSGAINARIAAALLNAPAVRAGLAACGWRIPPDTLFIAGHHDTTLDSVILLDQAAVPASHAPDVGHLTVWLRDAGAATRAERAASLGVAAQPPRRLERVLGQRGRDWSEVRPEWALARNAAFIAARRERTRRVDLAGRAFLHEYDHSLDRDNAVLTLILTAPLVVASWINLQYFGSTVDNGLFGCGTKTIHNRIGALGVLLGNGSDLRTGLAAQSVEARAGEWYHEPLRLQVIVEAPQAKIAAVLAGQPAVQALVDNGWLRLFALDPEGQTVTRWLPGNGWEQA